MTWSGSSSIPFLHSDAQDDDEDITDDVPPLHNDPLQPPPSSHLHAPSTTPRKEEEEEEQSNNHQPSPMVGVKSESGGGMMESIAETKKVVHDGEILDVNSPVGSVANACIPMAISDFYAAHPNFRTRLSPHHRNSEDALAVAFTATSLSLSTSQNPFLVRTTLDDSSQAKGITAIIRAYKWHEVILIYEDTEYGSGLIPYLADEFQQFDIRTRVIVVHMSSSLGSKIFLLAKETTMISDGYAWIITDGLSTLLDPMGAKVIGSMQGVLGIRPHIPQSKRLENFKKRWKSEIHSSSTKLNIFGYWAYNTVWALAKAVEMVPQESSSVNGENHHKNTCQFPVIKVSKIGKMILKRLLKTKFKGLSGDFSLVRGQLRSSAFEIIKVIDNKEKFIRYWTFENGLSRKLGKAKKGKSMSKYELKPPIWPGNTKDIPRGWTTPVGGNKLRIGVPDKPSFEAYLKVEQDSYTKESTITGFSYDVFEEALALLPFAVPHKLIPFPIGSNAGTYNKLLYHVKNQKIDAAVGDITILANSLILILTQSYTASLASMLTVQRLQSIIIDINELKKISDFVGYETGSFVKDLLVKRLNFDEPKLVKQFNFDESKLRDYGTAEKFDKALSKGSQNGGVGEIFGARHSVKLLLAKYCNKYMIVGPTY
ncbi:glutamate receptor 2.6-like [Gossypium hirsutum]|uniref:Glutamate receptor 2.6-like n=1 Tax=Gossypium hirsutum TaxID=3635 RepID=A0ABM3BJE3_GOSHI|nr:glutamate receptor 2.6-like [Gossypium hirsutum]